MWLSNPLTAAKFVLESVVRNPAKFPEFSLIVPHMAIAAQHLGSLSVEGVDHAFEQDSIGLTGY